MFIIRSNYDHAIVVSLFFEFSFDKNLLCEENKFFLLRTLILFGFEYHVSSILFHCRVFKAWDMWFIRKRRPSLLFDQVELVDRI